MGNFAVNHSKIYKKLAIQILINPSETLLLYSRTRLRRTRLGNNKKYVLTEVRLNRGTSYPRYVLSEYISERY